MQLLSPIGLGLALVCAAGAQAGDLRVRVSGVTEANGSVRVALFPSAADWEGDRPQAGHFTRATTEGVVVVFAGLPPGRYAVSSFHDRNGNEELDANLLGIPSEPFGFSRDARGSFGPPGFDDMAVELGDDTLSLEIELR